jgi:dihydropteroate synthase
VSSARLLSSGQGLAWECLIDLVGADSGCLPRVILRDRITAVLVEDLPGPAASILKQCMLSGGADALVHREVLTCRIPLSSAVVYGTPASILRGCYSLEGQPFGLPDIASAIRELTKEDSRVGFLRVNNRNMMFSDAPLIMGILNITPDSFSDGGKFFTPEAAAEQAVLMEKAGADIIDIGGESTRPGSHSVSAEKQISRVIPVIMKIRERTSIPLCIDTCLPDVAQAAVEAGAGMVNSIDGMETPGMAELAVSLGVPVAVMHKKGIPATMQINPSYSDVEREVAHYLLSRVLFLVSKGLSRECILVDPGIGFGKTLENNLSLLRSLEWIGSLTGCRVLLGHSRKTFLKTVTGIELPDERDSVTHIVTSQIRGADMVRVHDVPGTVAALKLTSALRRGL